jgi:clathrin heavy chain
METAQESKNPDLAELLARFFCKIEDRESFGALLFTCYELIRPDIAVELGWRYGFMEFAMPFFVQALKDINMKLDQVNKKTDDIQLKGEKVIEQQMNAPVDLEMMMPGLNPYQAIMPPPQEMMGMMPGMNNMFTQQPFGMSFQ